MNQRRAVVLALALLGGGVLPGIAGVLGPMAATTWVGAARPPVATSLGEPPPGLPVAGPSIVASLEGEDRDAAFDPTVEPEPQDDFPATPRPSGADRLAPVGGCLGCAWELEEPASLVPAPPERARRPTWLARHQAPDGSWSPASPQDDPCWSRPGHHPGEPRAAVGTTALVILSFVAGGQTHRFGADRRALRRAVRWLKEQQAPGFGPFGLGNAPEARWDHVLTTWALCDIYAVSRDFTLKRAATQAVAVCGDAVLDLVTETRDPVLGGWLVLALSAARVAQLAVPDDAFTRLCETFPLGGSPDDPLPLLAHLLAGGSRHDPGARDAAEALAARELRWEPGQVDLRRWYLATQALGRYGGRAWKDWREELTRVLLAHQRPQVQSGPRWSCGVGAPEPAEPKPEPPMDCREGSWDPIGVWGTLHGRAGETALATLCLCLEDRFERLPR